MTFDNGDLTVSATQSWKYPMSSSLASFVTVTLDKDLYVIGGEERLSVIDVNKVNDVMRCDVPRNQWAPVKSMLEPRASFDAVSLGTFCFLIYQTLFTKKYLVPQSYPNWNWNFNFAPKWERIQLFYLKVGAQPIEKCWGISTVLSVFRFGYHFWNYWRMIFFLLIKSNFWLGSSYLVL